MDWLICWLIARVDFKNRICNALSIYLLFLQQDLVQYKLWRDLKMGQSLRMRLGLIIYDVTKNGEDRWDIVWSCNKAQSWDIAVSWDAVWKLNSIWINCRHWGLHFQHQHSHSEIISFCHFKSRNSVLRC